MQAQPSCSSRRCGRQHAANKPSHADKKPQTAEAPPPSLQVESFTSAIASFSCSPRWLSSAPTRSARSYSRSRSLQQKEGGAQWGACSGARAVERGRAREPARDWCRLKRQRALAALQLMPRRPQRQGAAQHGTAQRSAPHRESSSSSGRSSRYSRSASPSMPARASWIPFWCVSSICAARVQVQVEGGGRNRSRVGAVGRASSTEAPRGLGQRGDARERLLRLHASQGRQGWNPDNPGSSKQQGQREERQRAKGAATAGQRSGSPARSCLQTLRRLCRGSGGSCLQTRAPAASSPGSPGPWPRAAAPPPAPAARGGWTGWRRPTAERRGAVGGRGREGQRQQAAAAGSGAALGQGGGAPLQAVEDTAKSEQELGCTQAAATAEEAVGQGGRIPATGRAWAATRPAQRRHATTAAPAALLLRTCASASACFTKERERRSSSAFHSLITSSTGLPFTSLGACREGRGGVGGERGSGEGSECRSKERRSARAPAPPWRSR